MAMIGDWMEFIEGSDKIVFVIGKINYLPELFILLKMALVYRHIPI